MLAEINAQIARRIKELAPREKSEDDTLRAALTAPEPVTLESLIAEIPEGWYLLEFGENTRQGHGWGAILGHHRMRRGSIIETAATPTEAISRAIAEARKADAP